MSIARAKGLNVKSLPHAKYYNSSAMSIELMLFREIISINSESNIKPIKTVGRVQSFMLAYCADN